MVLRKLGPSCLAIAAMVLVASQAPAQPADDVNRARELFIEGAKLSEAGMWEDARNRFERSLKLKHAAITLYNLGIAQQETGHVVDAVESFRAFLAMPEEPATQGFVAQVRVALPKLEARVVRLHVDVRPAGVKGVVLRIDGREVRASSGTWAVDPGPHEVTLTAPGYGEVHQKTAIAEGGRASLSLSLTPPVQVAPSLALPIGLGVGGLVLFLGGEVTFGLGVAKRVGSEADASSGKTLMIAGNAVAGAGAIVAGIGLVVLLQRVPRAKKAAVAPWGNGDVGGVEVRF